MRARLTHQRCEHGVLRHPRPHLPRLQRGRRLPGRRGKRGWEVRGCRAPTRVTRAEGALRERPLEAEAGRPEQALDGEPAGQTGRAMSRFSPSGPGTGAQRGERSWSR